jgi:hypothetical protein
MLQRKIRKIKVEDIEGNIRKNEYGAQDMDPLPKVTVLRKSQTQKHQILTNYGMLLQQMTNNCQGFSRQM